MRNFNIYFQTLTLSPTLVLPVCVKETLRICTVTPAIALTTFSSCSGAHLPVFSHLLTEHVEAASRMSEAFAVFVAAAPIPPPRLKTEVNKHAVNLYACSIAPCWTITGSADAYLVLWLLIKPF